jgi:hypothetical protein
MPMYNTSLGAGGVAGYYYINSQALYGSTGSILAHGAGLTNMDRSPAFWSNASDRSLAFTSGGPSTDATNAIGSNAAHNNMMPFIVANKIIKT